MSATASRLKDDFQKALESLDLETYLDREGIDYRHSHGTRGLQLNLRECPACHNSGFKTYINAESGLGNCFHGGCGLKFNRFWLCKHVSGLAGDKLDDYVKETASQQGWLPKKEAVKLVKGDLKLPTKTFDLPVGEQNLQYLADRGITLATTAYFQLKFCQGGWYGYKLDDGDEKWVSYNDRVIIPIADLAGNMVSFQGRDVTGEQIPKYLFPVGYAVAGSHLYHGWGFADGVTTHAIVGEGAFDAFAVHQALQGAPEETRNMVALATFGMHLSSGPDGQIEKFLQLKERGLTTVTFMWDSEKKATIAAVKAGLQLMGIGLKVRIARLPAGKDPNEVPAAVVRQAIWDATTLTRLSAITLTMRA